MKTKDRKNIQYYLHEEEHTKNNIGIITSTDYDKKNIYFISRVSGVKCLDHIIGTGDTVDESIRDLMFALVDLIKVSVSFELEFRSLKQIVALWEEYFEALIGKGEFEMSEHNEGECCCQCEYQQVAQHFKPPFRKIYICMAGVHYYGDNDGVYFSLGDHGTCELFRNKDAKDKTQNK